MVEGHGDLQAKHVYALEPLGTGGKGLSDEGPSDEGLSDEGLVIVDCIEFNDRFRYGDIAAEVAFLAMDLDHYGQSDLSHSFVDAYITFSQDKELLKLLNFYKCYRAYIRGKVDS